MKSFSSCEVTRGSADNIERVLVNPQHVGLAQVDVAFDALAKYPEQLVVSTANIGRECLFFATNVNEIKNLDHLPHRLPLGLAGEGSGSDLTFRFLQMLMPSLNNLQDIQRFNSSRDAVDALIRNEITMAFFVQFPNMQNSLFQRLLNAGNITFVPVISMPILRREVDSVGRQMLRHEVGGTRVYEAMEIELPQNTTSRFIGWWTGKPILETTCMRVAVVTGHPNRFAGNDAEIAKQLELIDALNRLTPPTDDGWQNIWDGMRTWSSDKLETVQRALGG